MPEDNVIAPVVDAPVVDAPVVNDAPVIQADSNVPVGLMIDNNTGEPDVQKEANQDREPSDLPNSSGTDAAVGAEGNGSAPAPESIQQAPEAQAQAPEPAPQLVDPGEFVPNDYSFDIALADGTKLTITKPEDIEALGNDVEFATPADFIKTQANYNKMVTGIENDKKAYDTDKSAFDTAQEQVQQQEQFISGIESGMNYLESSGDLPAVPAQYENADWSDPEVAKQPGVAERVAIIEYMATENARRDKAGVPRLTSVLDAHNAMQLKAMKDQQTVRTDAEKTARKARGAMVGGESSGSQGGVSVPDNMIVGPGGNIRD
jgi:hypothetical protein